MGFHEDIHDQEEDPGPAHGWIQWKGTDVCIDLRCPCGAREHFDGYGLYFYRCSCGASYALGEKVILVPLTKEQALHVENAINGFKRGES